MREHFDPKNGKLEMRLRSLLRDDGELQSALRAAVGGDDSVMAKTLATHVGKDSPLVKRLDPEAADGVIRALGDVVQHSLTAHRDAILGQFSLDVPDSALRRLIAELEKRHGKLEQSIEQRLGLVLRELTLDNENSALARLNTMVAETQSVVQRQLTLDDPESPMSRLQSRLMEASDRRATAQAHHQQEVQKVLAGLAARKPAEQRTPAEGATFEQAVVEAFTARAPRGGSPGSPSPRE